MKTLLLILACAVSCSGQQTDSFNLRVGLQGSTYGFYLNYSMELLIQITDSCDEPTPFSFRPKIDYLHKPYKQDEPFQNSHIRVVPINLTYSINKMSFSFSSGTILPVPKIQDNEQWGFLPYASFQVERQHYLFRSLTSYLFVDLYRQYRPVVKVGFYYRLKHDYD